MSELWSKWARERVRDFLTACTGLDWPGRASQAQALLDKLPAEPLLVMQRGAGLPSSAPTGRIDKSALAFPPPISPSRAERKAPRNAEMARIRRVVFARARRLCEFCRQGEPVTGHHTLKGSNRTVLESPYNVAAICHDCDVRTEAEPLWALKQALAWAWRLGGTSHDAADRAAFFATAEQLEGHLALAEAQARPLPTRTTEEP